MSIAPSQPITADDLLEMPDGDQFELVDGELVETPMSLEASWIAGRILQSLNNHLDQHRLGIAIGEGATYRCFPDDPEMVRKPDASFIRSGRLPQDQFEHGHCRIAPDLAVEVVSPNDLHTDLARKLQDYFSAGIPLVWVVEPELRLMTIYEQGGRSIRQVREGEELTAEELLPGFRVPVATLFPPARSAANPTDRSQS
jgi:Uma2 family endonuclease